MPRVYDFAKARFTAAMRALGRDPSAQTAADLMRAVPSLPDPPRGSVPCLAHTGTHCSRCRQDGRSLGTLQIPPTVAAWTARALDARVLGIKAHGRHEKQLYRVEEAHAWAEVAHRSESTTRSHAIEQGVLAFLAADERGEAVFLASQMPHATPPHVLAMLGEEGERIAIRRAVQFATPAAREVMEWPPRPPVP